MTQGPPSRRFPSASTCVRPPFQGAPLLVSPGVTNTRTTTPPEGGVAETTRLSLWFSKNSISAKTVSKTVLAPPTLGGGGPRSPPATKKKGRPREGSPQRPFRVFDFFAHFPSSPSPVPQYW